MTRPIVVYFHRNTKAGYSINKVTQTILSGVENKKEYFVPCYNASLLSIIKNIVFVIKRREHGMIHHVTGDIHYCILALVGRKSVLTIHDTVGLDFNKLSFFKRMICKWLWYKLPVLLASKVVCISNETKKKVSKLTNRDDIIVIYNAIDPSLKYTPKDQTKIPYNILFIGTSPNKNLERTVESLYGIDCKITIIGKLDSAQEDYLSKSSVKYEVKSNLTDEEMYSEYVKCDVVSFISLFEGFGMPIIEANNVGRPVITSTIPVLKEIAGDSAVFVNPENITEMHDGFVRLFNDALLRQQCVDRGIENAKRFDVKNICREYNALYESLL